VHERDAEDVVAAQVEAFEVRSRALPPWMASHTPCFPRDGLTGNQPEFLHNATSSTPTTTRFVAARFFANVVAPIRRPAAAGSSKSTTGRGDVRFADARHVDLPEKRAPWMRAVPFGGS